VTTPPLSPAALAARAAQARRARRAEALVAEIAAALAAFDAGRNPHRPRPAPGGRPAGRYRGSRGGAHRRRAGA
jgi:hypothetical protein